MNDVCVFCSIVVGDVTTKKIYEDENVLGFIDLQPQAKFHYLFIHKKHSVDLTEMAKDETNISQVFTAITKYAEESGLANAGFRVVSNTGKNAGQTIFHTHFHVLGGEKLGQFGSLQK